MRTEDIVRLADVFGDLREQAGEPVVSGSGL